MRKRLYSFYTWCADSGIAELTRLATTVETWWGGIEAFLRTGITNAAADGVNRLIKLVYRGGFGFTNVTHQQRRSRYAASRSTRPEWLHTVTASCVPSVVM